jgi:hypothetical protein
MDEMQPNWGDIINDSFYKDLTNNYFIIHHCHISL